MACSINYLKQRYQGDELQALVNHHYQIKDELAGSKLFQNSNGVLVYHKHKLVPEAIAKVGSINARYRGFVPNGTKIVHMDSNGLKINVLPIADKVIAENVVSSSFNTKTSVQEQNPVEEKLLYDTVSESDKEPASQEAEENLVESRKLFGKIMDDLRLRIKSLEESLKEKPFSKVYKEQIETLNLILENEDELKFISNYVAHSAGFLRQAKKQFDSLKEKYKNVENLTQKEVLDFNERMNEIREFLHFYTDLSEINTILKENDLTLQEEAKSILKDTLLGKMSEEQIRAFDETDLTSVNEVDDMYNRFKALFMDDFVMDQIKEFVNGINKKNLSVDGQLKIAIENQAAIVNEFKDYSIKLMADWLYPYMQVTNDKLASTGYEDDVVTKKELETLLRKAKKDVGFFARNLGATISNEDPVTALVALALKDLIYQAQANTNANIFELTDLFAKNKVDSKKIEEFHSKYLRKAKIKWFKKDKDGARIYKDENDDPYYTEVDALHQDLYYDEYDKSYTTFKIELERQTKRYTEEFEKNPALFIEANLNANVRIPFDFDTSAETYQKAWIAEFIRKYRGKQIAAWHETHSDTREDAYEYTAKKKSEMSDRRFENWLRTNARVLDDREYMDENGELYSYKDDYEEKGSLIPDEFANSLKLKPGQFAVYAGKFTIPSKELYENTSPEYLAIKDDPYFKELSRVYNESNDNYNTGRALPYGIIPQMGKDITIKEKYLNDNNTPSKEKIVKSLNDSIEHKENEQEIVEDDGNGNMIKIKVSRVKQNVDGSTARSVPVRYTAIFEDQSKLNRNLLETVIEFANAANMHKAMTTVEPNIEILKSVINGDNTLGIKARQITTTNTKGNPVVSFLVKGVPQSLNKDKGVRLNEMLTEFINDVVYDESVEQDSINILGKDVSLNKLANNLGFITSIYSMAFNVTSGVNNLILGNINTFSESIGGKYYDKNGWIRAHKTYWSAMGSGVFFDDLVENNWSKKSLLTQMQIHFDALQGEFLDTRGKIQTGTLMNKLMTKDTLFFNQHITEHEIQMKGMIAMMNGYKLSDGSSLFDAYEIGANGRMQVKESHKDLVDSKVEMDFRNKLHAINKQHHGNYNKFDKSSLQRKWYGQMALMFRKYLYTSFKARLGSKQVDYEIGDIVHGYYNVSARTAVKFFNKMRDDIKNNREWGLTKYYNEGLNANEQYAIRKTAAELSFLAIATLLVVGISALDLDDDDDVLNFVHLQSKRVQQDLLTFIPPFSFSPLLRLFTNPSAAFNVIEKANDLIQQLFTDPFATYSRKTGFAEKGDSKLSVKFQKLLPIWRQYINATTSSEQLKYYDLLKTGSTK